MKPLPALLVLMSLSSMACASGADEDMAAIMSKQMVVMMPIVMCVYLVFDRVVRWIGKLMQNETLMTMNRLALRA